MSYDRYKFSIKPLKYPASAYLPFLTPEALGLHHGAHLQRHVDSLNIELDAYPRLQPLTIEQIPAAARRLPKERARELLHHLGGVYCHHLYFDLLIPPAVLQTRPTDLFRQAVTRDFGSIENFFYLFKQAALRHEGDGWVWLLADGRGRLSVAATTGNDLPNLQASVPVLVLDLWEHAYYLTYRCQKGAYIDGFFRIINWKAASENYEKAVMKPAKSHTKKQEDKNADG